FPRVYRVAGAAQHWHQSLMAACLWGGDTAVASHRSAAALWCLDGFGSEKAGVIEITCPKQKHFPGRFRLHRAEVTPAFATKKLGIPVTNAFRTVLDLVNVLDEHRANQLLDEALRKGLVSMEALWRFVRRESGPGRRGVGKLRRLLEQRDPAYQPSASEFQAAVRALLVGAGLAFVEEYVVTDSEGLFVARVDFLLRLRNHPRVVAVRAPARDLLLTLRAKWASPCDPHGTRVDVEALFPQEPHEGHPELLGE